jgi:PAS domain S-box-containing protein
MKGRRQHSDLNNLINSIVNSMLVIGVIIGSLAYTISLVAAFKHGFYKTHVTDFFVISTLAAIAFFRNKINRKVKSIVILAGLFTLILTSMLNSGMYSNNVVLIALVPIYVYLVYDLKKTIWIYSILLSLVAAIAFLYINHIYIDKTDYTLRNTMVYPWILRTLIITVVAFLIVILVNKFLGTFLELIADLKQKNIEIAENEQSYREIFNSSADAIFIHDLEGNILEVNDAMLKTYGYTRADANRLSLDMLTSDVDDYTVNNAKEYLLEAKQSGKKVFDWLAKKKNGELFWVEVMLKRTHILGHKRILAIVTNIDEKKKNAIQLEKYKNHLELLVKERTEEVETTNEELKATNEELYAQREELTSTLEKLKSAQEKLVQAEKMASIGVLAAGVAHEINNPLNFIQGGATGLKDILEKCENSEEDAQVLLDAIHEGIERASAIVSSLNHFSRQGNTTMEDINIHEIIDNCLVIINNNLKGKVEVIKKYASDIPKLKGNDGKLHQAFLNILTNAEQAITKKGTIEINTSKNQHNLLVSIRDNGHGISKQNIARITEPFFTTKEVGSGTGLGLSITYNILKEHGGNIEFSSIEGKGTTVLISLPFK